MVAWCYVRRPERRMTFWGDLNRIIGGWRKREGEEDVMHEGAFHEKRDRGEEKARDRADQ